MRIIPLLVVLLVETTHAQGLSLDMSETLQRECKESGDFIRNTAIGRKNGMKRAFALQRLNDDLGTIRAFPPSARWFARTSADEEFLRNAVARVFDEPGDPERARARTIRECFDYKLAELPW